MKNACVIRRESFNEIRFPAQIYGYLALCQEQKHKKVEIDKNAIAVSGTLPFVSEMVQKSSPEGVRHAYWSFLKY